MAFTVRDFESLVRLLDRHPEWLEALRQRLLTREWLQAPETLRTPAETVDALAEAQRRHYEEFVTHRAETDRRFAELVEAIRRLTGRVEDLDERLRGLVDHPRVLSSAER